MRRNEDYNTLLVLFIDYPETFCHQIIAEYHLGPAGGENIFHVSACGDDSDISFHLCLEPVTHPVDHGCEAEDVSALETVWSVCAYCLLRGGEIKGGQKEAHQFIDSLEIFSLLANVADVKSLVIHPATTTHSQLTDEELADQGISQSTIRLSIGTEHIDDIIADLDQAFKAVFE